MFVVDECSESNFNDFQFGFIKIGNKYHLANDIASYCNSQGSALFIFGLEAEGAYDSIPHTVSFRKSMNAHI